MRFRYLQDPLFLLCLMTFAFNRYVLKTLLQSGFVHDHVNDLICIPFLVPIMLYTQRRLGLRDHDEAPRWYEVLIPIVVWSAVFEILLPRHPYFRHVAVADHLDVLFYVVGGFTATVIWRVVYRDTNGRRGVPTAD